MGILIIFVLYGEMRMIFSMRRPNVLGFGDLAIRRGLRMLCHHCEITKERLRSIESVIPPTLWVASLSLWAIAGGAIEGMRDYAPKEGKR